MTEELRSVGMTGSDEGESALVTQGGDHDGLDGVHAVLGLVEDDAVLALENVLGDLDAV